jgi:hypothetical protein
MTVMMLLHETTIAHNHRPLAVAHHNSKSISREAGTQDCRTCITKVRQPQKTLYAVA